MTKNAQQQIAYESKQIRFCYAINERIRKEQIGELRQLVQMVGRTIQNQDVADTTEMVVNKILEQE